MLRRFLNNDSGATALAFAIAAPVFIGGIIFAVELGHWHQKKSKLQDVADTSAIASAQEIMLLKSNANYEFAGMGHAFENGFDFNRGSMTIKYPPESGDYADREAVQVSVSKLQTTYFAKYFGIKNLNIETKAVAMILPGHEACILSLSPDAYPAISSGGSSTVDLNGCSVHTNSNAIGSIDVKDLTAECISSVGGIITSSQTVTECDRNLDYSFNIPDPYADVSVPSNVPSLPCLTPEKISKTSVRLVPGRYCNTISMSGLIDFSQPGTYYFDGSWLKTTGQKALIYGEGVTIVFMNNGGLANATGSEINLTAPTSGPFSGISFYFDRDTMDPDSWFDITGNQQSTIEGVIYGPTTNIKVLGAANSTSQCTQIVANQVHFNGNASFTNQNCEAAGVRAIGGQSGAMLVQ